MSSPLNLPRIQIVERRKTLLRSFAQWGKEWGVQRITSDSHASAINGFHSQPAELIVIDLDSEETMGMQLLHDFKQLEPDLVVILISAKISVETSLAALRGGAFDLLLKSSHPDSLKQTIERGIEQAMRVKRKKDLMFSIRESLDQLVHPASNKREGGSTSGIEADPSQMQRVIEGQPRIIRIRNLIIHVKRNQIQSQNGVMDLTPTEFDILLYLFSHKERIVECSELIHQLRGYEAEEKEARILIRPHVCNLRNKLRMLQTSPELIQNVRGKGYRLVQDSIC